MGFYFILRIILLFLITIDRINGTQTFKSLDEIKNFFKTTFIQKEIGYIPESQDSRKRAQYAPGFNPSWSLYRFHHVCLRGGGDGIYAAIDGVPQLLQPHSEYSMRIEEWNEYIGSRFNSPLAAFSLDESHINFEDPPILYENSTLFTNCNRQHSNAINPSHLMTNLGFLYELGSCLLKNLGRSKIFKHDIQFPFKQLFMHQCPNPVRSNWNWGKSSIEVIIAKLEESFLIKKNHSLNFQRGKESSEKEILCFEDLYLSSRTSHWIEGYDNSINFRRDMAYKTGEPAMAKEITERSLDFSSISMYQSYCNKNSNPPTNARIKLYQRTDNANPRTIINLNEVISSLQKFTTIPIEIITTTEKMPIQEQIRIFNSFDILVTTHGSHMTNGIFTIHPYTKAILEIVPFVYDNTFFRNYVNDLGFAEYIVSSGHLTPKANNSQAHEKSFCAFLKYSDFENRKCKISKISDPPKASQEWLSCSASFHSRSCNTWVNTTILEMHMNLLINGNLCKLVK